EMVGPLASAVEVVCVGADSGASADAGARIAYERSLPLADATRDDVLLAYTMNGDELPREHGAPLRLLVPGWYGMASVKWLRRIEAVARPFDGYQQRVAYWYKQRPDDPGEPVTRIRPRSLLVPPGFPDFFTRRRVVDRGRVEI